MSKGYTGKYGIVNLTDGTTETVEPGEKFYRKYLSGYGLGAAVITQRQKPGIDPLSSESYLGFCSGLLTGTGALFSGRFMVVGKSPLTGGWGDANAGGFFSRELKRTGYDALFFTGAAKDPVWVLVTDEAIEIKDASALWGKDTLETEEIIRNEQGDKRIQVASIGVSGEKGSLISGIVTDGGRIAARSGLGAVMGGKGLKALALRGKQKIPVAEPDRVKAINKKYLKDFKKAGISDKFNVRFMNFFSRIIARTGISIPATPSTVREIYRQYGTPGVTVYSALIGDMPIKNWDGVGYLDYTLESAAKNSDESVIRYQKRRYACQSCPLACGGMIDIKKGRYSGAEGHKPEYETLGAFGGLLLHDDLDAIIEINEMCNRAGIDTISAGACVAFAIECFEKGIIDEKTTAGLNLGWGQTQEIIRLTEMIIHREGFGDTLADGVKRAAEKVGSGSEKFAIHAGGQELPMHDSRLDQGYAISYQCEPTPGRHTISCYLNANLFGVKKIFPQARRMIKQARGKAGKDIQLYTAGSFYVQLLNGSGMCIFGALTSPLPIVQYLNAVTGWDLSADDYFTIGERILSLRKAFNVREGVTPEDQKLSGRAVGRPPLSQGPVKGVTVDMDALQKGFFETVGWDSETGGPTREKMKELGIDALFP
ncbi:MAG: aldehyde ferredoxin oxidoreductase family protein [Deltaproteobacteria bacterium]|nr:aldehyde ferredoxin oxidoreductase family protein [Deltaproteobacteria bacterium]